MPATRRSIGGRSSATSTDSGSRGSEPFSMPECEAHVGDSARHRTVSRHHLPAQRAVDRFDRGRVGHAVHGRSHPDDAVAERRRAQRPADVVAQTEWRHPRPDRCTLPTARAAGRQRRVPRVAGAATQPVARVDPQAELGKVGPADRDRAGGEHPVDDRRVRRGQRLGEHGQAARRRRADRSMFSFTVIGTPCSGPVGWDRSAASAAAAPDRRARR